MQRRALFSLCLFAALLPAATATAQERSPFLGDERLDRPASVSWKKATLYDALQELTGATGVKLSPDLAVVDEPIMAAATRLPARVLLEQVAELLDLTWSRSEGKSGTAKYLLYQSRSARERELAEFQKPGQPGRRENSGGNSPVAMMHGVAAPTAIYTLEVDLGSGQKDRYPLPISRAKTKPKG